MHFSNIWNQEWTPISRAGIDEDEWNPASDAHIAERYSVSNFTRGKAKNKAALQKELGLPERSDVPLVGFIGRLDYQKGADLVLAAAPWLISQDVQLVCLGTGDSGLEASRSHTLCSPSDDAVPLL